MIGTGINIYVIESTKYVKQRDIVNTYIYAYRLLLFSSNDHCCSPHVTTAVLRTYRYRFIASVWMGYFPIWHKWSLASDCVTRIIFTFGEHIQNVDILDNSNCLWYFTGLIEQMCGWDDLIIFIIIHCTDLYQWVNSGLPTWPITDRRPSVSSWINLYSEP